MTESIDRKGRPLGVSILAILSFIGGIFGLYAGGLAAIGASKPYLYDYGPLSGLAADASVVFLVLVAITRVIEGWGMWSGRNWAWILSLVLIGLGLISDFVTIFLGDWLNVIGVLVLLYLLSYLWRPYVRTYFRRTGGTQS